MTRVDRASLLASALLVLPLGSISAQAASADNVLAACKLYLSVIARHGAAKEAEIVHLMDAGECLGAVYALLNVSQALAEPLKFCPPLDVQAEQGVRAVVAYIENRPERARDDFTALAIEAFRKEWPCP
jgi:hypothetical protein